MEAELTERISVIEQEMMVTRTNYSKMEGHLAEAKHWLAEITKKEEITDNENVSS